MTNFRSLLWIFFFFICLLIGIRVIYSESFGYLFLVWNLFLALIPLLISEAFRSLPKRSKWVQFLILGCWFVFFPNSLYIVTDLLHLNQESIIPRWFDVLLLFSSSVLGLIMAYLSLFRLGNYLHHRFRSKQVNGIIAVVLFFGSFGVYLGRFLRWNSWDLIRNPQGLLSAVVDQFMFPFEHIQTWGMTFLFSGLFYLIYLLINKIPIHLGQRFNDWQIRD